MSEQIDITILELLSSKICHDLISPIGAVCNGIEFMTEMGADAGDEAVDLIAYSAQQASAKLQAYRMAYGAGGADGSIKPEEVHKSIESIIGADGKLKQVWDPHGELGFGFDRPDAYSKLLMCAILLGIEFLPKGGEIDVVAAGEGQTNIIVSGENAAPRELMAEALALEIPKDELEPKHVHPYITGLIAKRYGYGLSLTPEDGSVTIAMTLPAAT